MGVPGTWEFDEGCAVTLIPDLALHHQSKRVLYRLTPRLTCFCTGTMQVHDKCACNELRGVVSRVLGQTTPITQRGTQLLSAGFTWLKRRIRQRSGAVESRWSPERVAMGYSGAKRSRYLEAARRNRLLGPVGRKHARIRAFIKADKVDFEAKPFPDPRVIQAREPAVPRYALEIARFLKPIEHAAYGLKTDRSFGVPKTLIIAKCLNQKQRARLVRTKWNHFKRPRVYTIDVSRFDKHVKVEHLQATHGLYLSLINDPDFQRLLSYQLENRCITEHGVRYKTLGKRMSGDIDTALGNCMLMVAMVYSAVRAQGVRKFDLLDDGDDCLLFVEAGSLNPDRLVADFVELGMVLKLEGVADKVHQIEFCRSKPVATGEGPKMVRHWDRVMRGFGAGYRHWREPKGCWRVAKAVGACELYLGRGVPILQAIGQAMLEKTADLQFAKVDETMDAVFWRAKLELGGLDRLGDVKPIPITQEARVSFAAAFGVDPSTQRIIEELVRQWGREARVETFTARQQEFTAGHECLHQQSRW